MMLTSFLLSFRAFPQPDIEVQSFPSHRAERFFGFFLVSSPGLWAATAKQVRDSH